MQPELEHGGHQPAQQLLERHAGRLQTGHEVVHGLLPAHPVGGGVPGDQHVQLLGLVEEHLADVLGALAESRFPRHRVFVLNARRGVVAGVFPLAAALVERPDRQAVDVARAAHAHFIGVGQELLFAVLALDDSPRHLRVEDGALDEAAEVDVAAAHRQGLVQELGQGDDARLDQRVERHLEDQEVGHRVVGEGVGVGARRGGRHAGLPAHALLHFPAVLFRLVAVAVVGPQHPAVTVAHHPGLVPLGRVDADIGQGLCQVEPSRNPSRRAARRVGDVLQLALGNEQPQCALAAPHRRLQRLLHAQPGARVVPPVGEGVGVLGDAAPLLAAGLLFVFQAAAQAQAQQRFAARDAVDVAGDEVVEHVAADELAPDFRRDAGDVFQVGRVGCAGQRSRPAQPASPVVVKHHLGRQLQGVVAVAGVVGILRQLQRRLGEESGRGHGFRMAGRVTGK